MKLCAFILLVAFTTGCIAPMQPVGREGKFGSMSQTMVEKDSNLNFVILLGAVLGTILVLYGTYAVIRIASASDE
jgi:hypothetical protein